jgi:CheY-like chemotaxis protein
MTFLVVDDHPDEGEILAMLLGSEGGVVRRASAAEEGLELFKTAPPTAVITDLCMRGARDRAWLLQQIRSIPAGRVPVIAVSGSRLEDEAAIADAARFDARLLKPVDLDVLVETITGFTRRRLQTP